MTELTKQRVRWIVEQGDLYHEVRRERERFSMKLAGVIVVLQLVQIALQLVD